MIQCHCTCELLLNLYCIVLYLNVWIQSYSWKWKVCIFTEVLLFYLYFSLLWDFICGSELLLVFYSILFDICTPYCIINCILLYYILWTQSNFTSRDELLLLFCFVLLKICIMPFWTFCEKCFNYVQIVSYLMRLVSSPKNWILLLHLLI